MRLPRSNELCLLGPAPPCQDDGPARAVARLWQSGPGLTGIIVETLGVDPINAECLAGILTTMDRKGLRGCEILRERIRPEVQHRAQQALEAQSSGESRVHYPQEVELCAG